METQTRQRSKAIFKPHNIEEECNGRKANEEDDCTMTEQSRMNRFINTGNIKKESIEYFVTKDQHLHNGMNEEFDIRPKQGKDDNDGDEDICDDNGSTDDIKEEYLIGNVKKENIAMKLEPVESYVNMQQYGITTEPLKCDIRGENYYVEEPLQYEIKRDAHCDSGMNGECNFREEHFANNIKLEPLVSNTAMIRHETIVCNNVKHQGLCNSDLNQGFAVTNMETIPSLCDTNKEIYKDSQNENISEINDKKVSVQQEVNSNKDPSKVEETISKWRRKEKRFFCGECSKGYPSEGHLRQHMRTHSDERPYTCGECGTAFKRSMNLYAHMRIHLGERPYVCNVCDKGFTHNASLKGHIRIHTGEKPYKCTEPECSSAFANLSALKSHRRVHTGEKPYKCTRCDKAFTVSNALTQHTRTHTGERPYHCSHCDKAFMESSSLKDHFMLYHTDERPFKCNTCGKGFIRITRLKNHEKTHVEKNVKCKVCGKRFTSLPVMEQHALVHLKEKAYKCCICDKKFTLPLYVDRHMKKHHSDSLDV